MLPKLIDYIRKEDKWGDFFPKELSPFGYNESIVSEYMPLTKEEAISQGFKWRDDIPSTKGQGTVSYADLPKDPDSIVIN